ncbi:MAG: magnesium transporter [bacterium]
MDPLRLEWKGAPGMLGYSDSMLGRLIEPEIKALLAEKNYKELRESLRELDPVDIAETISVLSEEERAVVFRLLPRSISADVFEYLSFSGQEEVLRLLGHEQVSSILNEMDPDDRTALLEELPGKLTRRILELLSPEERAIAKTLLGYPEDSVGRLMTPEYMAVREDWTVDQTIAYIRKTGREKETVNILYVTDEKDRLIADLKIRSLIFAESGSRIRDIMNAQVIALNAFDDQEAASRAMLRYDVPVLPVVDSDGTLVGIVTSDDVFDVVVEEATEDMHRMGGLEAIDEPYFDVSYTTLVRKRAGWLSVLFLGEMLTSTAMSYFEQELQRAIVLALFIPLIISSGGNSGSQAASLIIRAMALQHVQIRDWIKVFFRELTIGLLMGCVLGLIAFARITLWPSRLTLYGPHFLQVAFTVNLALVGVVMFGTLTGSMLPFLLRKLGFDPALSSAPFVATIVDVMGIVIYFTVALLIMEGTLL